MSLYTITQVVVQCDRCQRAACFPRASAMEAIVDAVAAGYRPRQGRHGAKHDTHLCPECFARMSPAEQAAYRQRPTVTVYGGPRIDTATD